MSGVVASFSLRRNWSTLTALEDPGADDIRCIHGVRSVCSLLLYAAHKVGVLEVKEKSVRMSVSLWLNFTRISHEFHMNSEEFQAKFR